VNINRHNYEEFFLLFADNELCAADRKAVEIFVAENPDLKKELQLLLQTVSSIDDVVFENKEQLLKPAVTSLQEQLLLHIDDELAAAEKQQLLQLINTDDAAAKELALLQQTKLQPDTAIVFTNKKELYRKEEGRVVRIAWWRAAAAAVLLGFGIWGALTLIKPEKPAETTTSSTSGTPAKAGIQAASVIVNTVNTAPINTVAVKTNNTATAQKKNNLPVTDYVVKQQKTPVVNDNNTVVKKEDNNLPKPLYNNINSNNRNETITSTVTPINEETGNAESGAANNVTSLTPINTGVVNGYAVNASFTGQNSNETEDPGADENKSKRTRLGGFMRKVKRLVERTANVKTGNGIKVAGFDIALNK
jgi:anti-sigma factor RsiW